MEHKSYCKPAVPAAGAGAAVGAVGAASARAGGTAVVGCAEDAGDSLWTLSTDTCPPVPNSVQLNLAWPAPGSGHFSALEADQLSGLLTPST